MLNVCFGCGQPASRSGSLPIYDSKRKVRFTNVGPLVAVQRLRINVCARCFGRLLLVRLIPWIAFAAFLLSLLVGTRIWQFPLVVALLFGVWVPVVLAGRLFPAVDRVSPDWILFRRVPEQFRSQLPSCAELRPGLDNQQPHLP
jgi:hypothetical protein